MNDKETEIYRDYRNTEPHWLSGLLVGILV